MTRHPAMFRNFLATFGVFTALVVSGCVVVSDKDKTAKKTDSTSTLAAGPAQGENFDTTDITAPTYATDSADTAGISLRQADSAQSAAAFRQISMQSANADLSQFGKTLPKGGAIALKLQVLLDRAGFSPGVIDGTWGKNAAQALKFFQTSNQTDSTGGAATTDSTKSGGSPRATKSSSRVSTDAAASLDKATYDRLISAAGSAPVVTSYTVSADDVKGPFSNIPGNVYEKAKLQCLCYTSPLEELSEKFHASPRLLKQLNQKVDLTKVAAGTSITVPNVADSTTTSSQKGLIAKLVISKKGFWTNAVDGSGKVIYHFPSTLGAGYDPSPTGDFHITGIAHNPAFHYQPTLFAEVPDNKPTARLPSGPNSPVGTVWMALSKPHYGIHGTSDPETIGYASSHGCVRLTNWDAEKLSRLVHPGVPVVFE